MKFDHKNDYFWKYPTDTFTIKYSFKSDISANATIDSCTASITDSDGTDKSASYISSVSASTPHSMSFRISDGEAGETYSIKLGAWTTDNDKYTHHLTCEVFGSISLNTKLGDTKSNSYVTLKEANDYIRKKYGHKNVWDTLSVEGKKQVLIESADIMNKLNYINDKYYDSQSLIFPLDSHDIITGNCGTPITTNSFRHSSLKSGTYGKYPTDYWKYGTVHIKSGNASHNIRNISLSHVQTGSVTVSSVFSENPNSTSAFIVFTPLKDEVKDAQCEQALFIVENVGAGGLQEYRSLGAESIRIGDVRVDFSEGATSKVPIAPMTKKLLSRWLRRVIRVGRA